MARTAIYAGSFDPITRGHEDVIERALVFVDRLVVAIAINAQKQPLFSLDERLAMLRAALGDNSRIDVRHFDGLLVDFAREVGASLIIRGLRAVSDFEYEFQMALMNRHLSPGLETVFMVPSLDTTYISSSLVREVARFGGKIDDAMDTASQFLADGWSIVFASGQSERLTDILADGDIYPRVTKRGATAIPTSGSNRP
jgi:pantetheine-phosphate adenylyltransferase